jgi:hypothetical protein
MFQILIGIAVIVGMLSAIAYLVVLFKHHGNPTYDSTVTLMGLALLAFIGCLVAQAWMGVICWIICFCTQLYTFIRIGKG